MALTNKLTAIADAIRSKTGKTEEMTLDQMVTEISGIETGGGSGGGSSSVYSGSFTPVETVASVTIDIGRKWEYFAVYAIETVSGHSVKATYSVFVDFNTNIIWGLSTNNAGSSLIAVTSNQMNGDFVIINNSRIDFYDTSIKITGGTAGSSFGYFIGGVTYKWLAW